MARTLSGGTGRKWDREADKGMTVKFLGVSFESFQGDKKSKDAAKRKPHKGPILSFWSPTAGTFERNCTTQWEGWTLGDKELGVKAALKSGDVLKIREIKQEDLKGGNRFYSFTVDILEGKEIPASFKR